MKKIHCKDCRYLHHNTFDYHLLTCTIKHVTKPAYDVVYGDHTMQEAVPTMHPTVRNSNSDCKLYKNALTSPWAFFIYFCILASVGMFVAVWLAP